MDDTFFRWSRGDLHTPEERAEMAALAVLAMASLLAVMVYVSARRGHA